MRVRNRTVREIGSDNEAPSPSLALMDATVLDLSKDLSKGSFDVFEPPLRQPLAHRLTMSLEASNNNMKGGRSQRHEKRSQSSDRGRFYPEKALTAGKTSP